ncbi:hypothetical protein BTA51_28890, partial [Hahella sp. CCB-MM4]|uniref:hypothetical protein n=1 Tax=Hahella sp. (strain CCB-MM4) TaxID=1926491 RepID=UPI000BD1BE57
FRWRDVATSFLSTTATTGLGKGFTGNALLDGGLKGALNSSFSSLTNGSLASETIHGIAAGTLSEGIRVAVYDNEDYRPDYVGMMAGVLGSTIGSLALAGIAGGSGRSRSLSLEENIAAGGIDLRNPNKMGSRLLREKGNFSDLANMYVSTSDNAKDYHARPETYLEWRESYFASLDDLSASLAVPVNVYAGLPDLPPYQNLYEPRVGTFENYFMRLYDNAANDRLPTGIRALNGVASALIYPLATFDGMISGVYNWQNNADLMGQALAKGNLSADPYESNLAYLESIAFGSAAVLGVGDPLTMVMPGPRV